MVNNILKQRFNFFEITLYRDYSTLSSRPEKEKVASIELETTGIDDLFLFLDETITSKRVSTPDTLFLHNKKGSKKKNTKFFYCDDDLPDDKIQLYSLGTFYTQDETKLKKYYGDPFAKVKTTILERNISMSDEKISIRFCRFEKHRDLNCKYFRKSTYSMGVTMNLKTGNIIIYRGDKKIMKIRQNSFIYLQELLKDFLKETNACTYDFSFLSPASKPRRTDKINELFLNQFVDSEFNKILFHTISSKTQQPDSRYFVDPKTITDFAYKGFLKLFIQVNKIKVPNNYEDLILRWYPTKKYLKNNDNKLVVSILDRMGLKTKSLIKLLHSNPKLDLCKLTLLGKYFGYSNVHKYIHNLSPYYFDNSWILYDDQNHIESMYSILNDKFEYDIRDSERSVLLKLINEFFNDINVSSPAMNDSQTIKHQIRQFNDHLDLITKIRVHIPEMEIKCNGLMDFHHEHLELSKIDRSIKKGYTIQYTFDNKLIKHVENVIKPSMANVLGSEDFYPVILKSDSQYTEEGAHMHHCVATYADRDNSVIISIREKSSEGHERVTCEFDLQKKMVQAKYYCNAKPPERFEAIIEKLKHRIETYRGSIKSTGKEKIPLVINGKTIEIKEREQDAIYRMLFDNEREF